MQNDPAHPQGLAGHDVLAKLKEAIPASTLSKLEGKVTVKPKEK